ncbi:unnamed protein product [Protopolystoma xenopodis]|uniref:Uncharacterized protein n=1 Tax=Protopolystoma xenopodis TaxID=117903 RepID=A0A448XMU1_9PLAT|nr:unnamed protein product [Protopolystoma xenopodis]
MRMYQVHCLMLGIMTTSYIVRKMNCGEKRKWHFVRKRSDSERILRNERSNCRRSVT